MAVPSKKALLKELIERAKGGDSLAMDYASRMARAKEQGFDKPKYHTTVGDIESFNRGENSASRSGKGIYTADTPKYGNLLTKLDAFKTGGEGYNTMPLMVRSPKPYKTNMKDMPSGGIDADKLEAQGFTGVELYSDEGKLLEETVFDPSNIRSVNATFDPAKSSSSNLLASAAPAAVGMGALGGALYTPEQNAAMAGQLISSGVEDLGSITPDEFPFLQRAGDFLDKWTQTPFGSPVEGLADYLRGFGQDDDTQAKAERAFFAALDMMP